MRKELVNSLHLLGRMGLLCCLILFPASGLDKWTVDDALKVKEISRVIISPDGKRVLYTLSWSVPAENRRRADLFVTAADGSRTWQLTDDDAAEDEPGWVARTGRVSYISGGQVWSVAPGGRSEKTTDAERPVRSYAWSADGARLLYITEQPKPAEQVAQEKEWGEVISPEEKWPQRYALWLAARAAGPQLVAEGEISSPRFSPDGSDYAWLEGGRLRVAGSGGEPATIAVAGAGIRFFAWSPDGKMVAYVAARDKPEPYRNYFVRPAFQGSGSVWLLDRASGRTRRLTPAEHPGLARVLWSHDSRRLTFLARSPGTENDRKAIDKLHIVSTSAELRTGAPGFDFLRGGLYMTWSADDREIWFLNGERMGYNMFAVNAATGELSHLTSGQDCIGEVSYAADLTAAAFVSENVNTKPDIYLACPPDWRGVRITDINADTLRFASGKGEIIRYPSEGREIEALLITPPDFDRRKKYPLILIVHGGPTWYKKNDWRPEWEQHPIQPYASEGYCLLFPNVRGSADYGVEFRQANYRDLGGGDFRDAMAGVDFLIAQGFVDPERLGVAGWSYGGYLTPAIITKTGRFKAAQFGAGIPSLEAMYSRLSTVEWIVHENYGPRPWEDARMQIQDSPLYSAWKVKTPTLIEHGEDDPRCPVGGSILFYKALKFYGVPAVLEIYPKEGHGITAPLLRRRCVRRNLEWFNRWLKDDRSNSFGKLFP